MQILQNQIKNRLNSFSVGVYYIMEIYIYIYIWGDPFLLASFVLIFSLFFTLQFYFCYISLGVRVDMLCVVKLYYKVISKIFLSFKGMIYMCIYVHDFWNKFVYVRTFLYYYFNFFFIFISIIFISFYIFNLSLLIYEIQNRDDG